MAEDPLVKLGFRVPQSLRLQFRMFCLPRNLDMQDIVRAMVEKFLAEARQEPPSQFVTAILEKVAPPPTEGEPDRQNVVPIPRRPTGRNEK